MSWNKKTPTEDGWYWVKYRGKNGVVVCPALVTIFAHATIVATARNDSFYEGDNHGGLGLKCNGKLDKSFRFGSKIEQPK